MEQEINLDLNKIREILEKMDILYVCVCVCERERERACIKNHPRAYVRQKGGLMHKNLTKCKMLFKRGGMMFSFSLITQPRIIRIVNFKLFKP